MPVVVYIHGGRYLSGSFEEEWIRPEALNAQEIIVVSVEYRTGLEGFVPFFTETPHHYRGIDDCMRALEWVQAHIEEYGGDPTNVTLLGQSAGAGIALWLARRDHFRGLFRRVWAISPAFPRGVFVKRKSRLRACLSAPITAAGLSRLSEKRRQRGLSWFGRLITFDLPLGPAPFDATELANIPIVATATDREMFLMPEATQLDTAPCAAALRPLLKVLMGMPRTWRPKDPQFFARQLVGDSMIHRWVEQLRTSYPHPDKLWTGIIGDKVHHCEDIAWLFGHPSRDLDLHQDFVAFTQGRAPAWKPGEPKQWKIPHVNDPR